MPKKLEPPLLVELKPSRRLKRLLIAMHLLALAASSANALPVIVKLALLIGISIQLNFTIKRLASGHCSIKHSEAQGWAIDCDNDFAPIRILDSTVITVFAICLHFSRNGRKQSVLIVNDALSAEDYRRLIVRLKTTDHQHRPG